MTWTPWKTASILVLCAALGYRLMVIPPKPAPKETAGASKPARMKDAPGEPSRQATELLQRIDDGTIRMHNAGRRFGEFVSSAIEGNQVDDGPLRRSFELALNDIRGVRSDILAGGKPTFASGQALMKSYLEYLDWQENVYTKDYAALIDDLYRPDLTPAERRNVTMAVLIERSHDERARNEKLNVLRDEMRREFAAD